MPEETMSVPMTAEVPEHVEAEVLSDTDSEDSHFRWDQVVTWINISGKRRFRRLHRWNGCSRRPLADRMSYELYAGVPKADDYHDFCRTCWRSGT
eukprot:6655647-Karenia_brevis.AAC.1